MSTKSGKGTPAEQRVKQLLSERKQLERELREEKKYQNPLEHD